MPGGALTANTQMLRDNNMMDKYHDIINEMTEVVKLGGFGTSVTPVSQFYFQQAFNNVVFGKWKKIAQGYGKMILGYFGKTPVPADKRIIDLAKEQLNLEPTNLSPIDIDDKNETKSISYIKKELEKENLDTSDENIFILATCKEKGLSFLKGNSTCGVRYKQKNSSSNSSETTIKINNELFNVKLKSDKAIVNNREYSFKFLNTKDNNSTESNGKNIIKAPMSAKVLKINKNVGDMVSKDELIVVLEAMKMEININATVSGKIKEIYVSVGDRVSSNDKILSID